MVKTTFFDRGDIVRVSFDPVIGRELQGEMRPALVLSPQLFNTLGTPLVAPITQGGNFARQNGFAVPLTGTKTQGVVLINAMRTLDLMERGAIKIEKVPEVVIADALARAMTLIE